MGQGSDHTFCDLIALLGDNLGMELPVLYTPTRSGNPRQTPANFLTRGTASVIGLRFHLSRESVELPAVYWKKDSRLRSVWLNIVTAKTITR